jgi:gamma-glutamylcyclotransferase (GGCT)/AIG2-like uncharacterized protein YtfP
MFYFAYGSNLSKARLLARVPSTELITTGSLLHHRLTFHKIGKDLSAKCDAYETGNDRDHVLGALYRIDPAHKKKLDDVEGLGRGYEEKEVSIISGAGKKMNALTYYATNIDAGLKPFHWYRGHVLIGAMEHEFPEDYIARISSVPSIDDPDIKRSEKEMAIHRSETGRRDIRSL